MKELTALLELLGEDSTLKLVQAYGGTRLSVPKTMPQTHALRDLLGDDGFALLFQYFGGSEIPVPIARRWRFDIYKKRGITRREIARHLGCSEKTVYAYFRGEQRAQGQLTLSFD